MLVYIHDFTIHSADILLNIFDAATRLSKSHGMGFYISSSPFNIANAITAIENHSTLQVFRLLHFYYSSSAYSISVPASEPLISGFDVLIFSHNQVPMSTIWHPQPSDTIPEPYCYLHHIPIPHPKREIVCSAPAFLTVHSSDRTPLHIGLYSYLIQSLDLPEPAQHPLSSSSTPHHILYEANPTYYLSFCAALYSGFVCLSSAPVAESNIPSLANWLLTFYSKFLEDSDLEAISSFLKGLYSHPGLTPLPPRSISSSSSSSSSGQRKPRKSIG